MQIQKGGTLARVSCSPGLLAKEAEEEAMEQGDCPRQGLDLLLLAYAGAPLPARRPAGSRLGLVRRGLDT